MAAAVAATAVAVAAAGAARKTLTGPKYGSFHSGGAGVGVGVGDGVGSGAGGAGGGWAGDGGGDRPPGPGNWGTMAELQKKQFKRRGGKFRLGSWDL